MQVSLAQSGCDESALLATICGLRCDVGELPHRYCFQRSTAADRRTITRQGPNGYDLHWRQPAIEEIPGLTRVAVFSRRGLHGLTSTSSNRGITRHRRGFSKMAKFTLSSLDVCGGESHVSGVPVSVGPQILSPEISCRLTIAFASLGGFHPKAGFPGLFLVAGVRECLVYSWLSRIRTVDLGQVCVRLHLAGKGDRCQHLCAMASADLPRG